VHHVISRGNERREIFRDDRDRVDLLDRLRAVVPQCGAAVYAWAFMPNHVHLVVRSGQIPLSRMMHRIETGYAMHFNRRHDRVGHLFQDRFKSPLVVSDVNLMNLIRYVHLNPVKAKIVADVGSLAQWRWSGHGALMGLRHSWEFEDATFPLALFSADSIPARAKLLRSMEETAAETSIAAADAGRPIPPNVATLIARACGHYGASTEELARGVRSGGVTSARALVCYVAVVRWGLSRARVAPWVGVSGAAVGQALARGARLAEWDLRAIGGPHEESYLSI
jgi:REP element-mobilizing transposase RayT